MKTYDTPSIASKGTVIEATRTMDRGVNDPKDVFTIQLKAPGSLGFQL